MLKRTIYIGNPMYLSAQRAQLVLKSPTTRDVVGQVPIEDIALLMLDNPRITITQHLLQSLAEYKVALITCDASHMPLSIALPLSGHTSATERLRWQIEASEPLKKQLWKQTIEAKITNQAAVIESMGNHSTKLLDYRDHVLSGDSTNMEGIAAQHYWDIIHPDFDRVKQGGTGINAILNFGYAVIRSMIARALVSSGLHTSLGIFHRNKYNNHCLADDIMEPYRPLVDSWVFSEMKPYHTLSGLSKEAKAKILELITMDVSLDNKTKPLMVAMSSTTASLAECLAGRTRKIAYPNLKI